MSAETCDGESKMQPMAVPGLAEAQRLYGEPQVCAYDLGDCGDVDRFWEMWERRQAEVVLVLRRPDGRIILQTKAFYPAGTFRLPTGGIRPREDLLAAVRRETQEETGLAAQPLRFLGNLRYRFRRLGVPAERESYVFLLDAGPGALRPQDETEQITAFREVCPAELVGVAAQLAEMVGEWSVWGRFRALVHRFVAGALCDL
jgi:8-oxo-dGTP pyrophosphatase MutT (NUDIX family)